ncbi:PfaB family protein [Shewanella sp. JNE10-2]|uniref:Omega-3 polyunsaturated fatty acid synthase, PfaB n=1 Tax=Shewanella putrefaciens (strain 200) TaxID=399804 RepID=E6XR46_SHEP2|nr:MULTISPECIES: PfaB family protein [unclassified Shewanella]MCK7628298.1 PfaB family protein [Shewanella sp. JNE9-1]MCK7632595.1 PfaB family protein [Shewanella sp. JNE17]MCK7643547.1 PfaB family protein [Shewanella sp. JNE3-1]MCK7648107.1 PfaB family protein [Shewanella sp. JNE8]MCK7651601.1 PfaB family protein [Shewanella sp. JNE4-1]
MNLASPLATTNSAKPLRIAVLLGDAVNLSPHSAQVLGTFAERERVQICAANANQSTAHEPKVHEPSVYEQSSLTALLGQAVTAIEQGKLVELKFNDGNQPQPLTQSLYLLDGLRAAKLRLHAHAFIAGFAAGNEATGGANAGVANAAAVANAALVAAKRSPAQTVQHQLVANTLNEAFVALRQGVTALAARTQAPLHGATDIKAANGTNHQAGYWFSDQHQARVLCLNLVAKTSNQVDESRNLNQSIVLTQGTQVIAPKALVDENRLFVPISGDSIDSLIAQVLQLVNTLENGAGLHADFRAEQLKPWFERYDANATLALVLMAASIDDLKLEAKAMLSALENDAVRHHGQAFKTPAGSCFTAKPLGDAGLTFVYPGVGTVYANMFNNLHEYFPTLYHQLEREGDLSAMLQSPQIYAADVKTAAGMSLSQQAISGVGASYLFTKLLTQVFNIKPKMALGYSMGEAAMWASLDVWQTPHAMIKATENSDIFNHAISGELTAVRRVWQLKDNESIVWNSFVVRADSNEIKALLPEFPRAYLAIIQGDTCVIAGCETSCKALLAKLGKRGIAANRVTAMHTAPAMLVHGQVQDFYTQAVKPEALKPKALEAAVQDLPIRFISAAQTAPVTVDSHSIGRAIADTFCSPLDFSALIQNATEQGARLFVEVGADRQTSTLIDKISHAHAGQSTVNEATVAIACNAKGADAITSLLKCLAQLISHRVPLSLAPLMQPLSANAAPLSSAVSPKGEPQ